MNSVIIYQDAEGCKVVHPAPEMFDPSSRTRKLIPALEGATDEEVLAWIIAKDVPQGAVYSIIDKTALPPRTFRNAWEHLNNAVSVNFSKAVEIKKQGFRNLRAPLLEKLDAEYMRADEAADATKKQKVAQIKQQLRDVTIIPGSVTTVEQLTTYQPSVLDSATWQL